MKKIIFIILFILASNHSWGDVNLWQFNMQGQLVKKLSSVIVTGYVPLGIECEHKNLLVIVGDSLTTATTYQMNKKGQIARSYTAAFGHRGITTNQKGIIVTSQTSGINVVAAFDKQNNLNNYVLFTQAHWGITNNTKNLLSPIVGTGTFDIFNLKGSNFLGVKTVTVTGATSLSGITSHRERLSVIDNLTGGNKLMYIDYNGSVYKTIALPYDCNIGEVYIGQCTDGKNIWIIGYDSPTCA